MVKHDIPGTHHKQNKLYRSIYECSIGLNLNNNIGVASLIMA